MDWLPFLKGVGEALVELWPRAVILLLVVLGTWLYFARHARSFRRAAADLGFLPDPENRIWEFDLGESRLYREGDRVRNLLRGSMMGVPMLLFELHPRAIGWRRDMAQGKPLTICAAPLPLSGPPPTTAPYSNERIGGYLLLYEPGLLLPPRSLRRHVLDVLSLIAPDKFIIAVTEPGPLTC